MCVKMRMYCQNMRHSELSVRNLKTVMRFLVVTLCRNDVPPHDLRI